MGELLKALSRFYQQALALNAMPLGNVTMKVNNAVLSKELELKVSKSSTFVLPNLFAELLVRLMVLLSPFNAGKQSQKEKLQSSQLMLTQLTTWLKSKKSSLNLQLTSMMIKIFSFLQNTTIKMD